MSKSEPQLGRKTELTLEEGKNVAGAILERLAPFCERIEVAGSIRRRRPVVHDVDILLIPQDHWHLVEAIRGAGQVGAAGAKKQTFVYEGVQVDIYFATRESWATLLLVKTGSAENNIRLAARAKSMGWQLKANGEGLLNGDGRRVASDTEESIYAALGLPYQDPPQREATHAWH